MKPNNSSKTIEQTTRLSNGRSPCPLLRGVVGGRYVVRVCPVGARQRAYPWWGRPDACWAVLGLTVWCSEGDVGGVDGLEGGCFVGGGGVVGGVEPYGGVACTGGLGGGHSAVVGAHVPE